MGSRHSPFVLLLLSACASHGNFAPRPPLGRDTDLASVTVPCHDEPSAKDPHHVSCAPEPYVSPLVWDGMDNSVFRPVSDVLAIRATKEAANATSIDEVADSAWFTNRIGVGALSVEELRKGACRPSQYLAPSAATDGSWVIDQGKPNGDSLGFRVRVPGNGKYMFKNDSDNNPERASAASVIGAAVYYAVGFFSSCEQVVYFRRSLLKLTPGLHRVGNTGVEEVFDRKALDMVLSKATKRGELIRMQASAWLPGYLIGPFRYEGTRSGDPNDIIPHEDRRELRGVRLLAAWLNHYDSREQNSMDSWIADQPAVPDSSPGYVRHYYLDTSDSLGSEWAWDGISRRLGRAYVLDWGDIGRDFVTLGIPTRDWEAVQRAPGREKFGYFDVATFDPEAWKNEYPNPAFSRMTERDGAWMARILAHFTKEMVRTLAEMGNFSDPTDTDYLAYVLEARLERILDRYLTRLSPLSDVHLEGGVELCAFDLARYRQVRKDSAFHYEARLDARGSLPTTVDGDGRICVALPRPSSSGYHVVSIYNGVAKGPLDVHLYDLGAVRGYLLAGLERPLP